MPKVVSEKTIFRHRFVNKKNVDSPKKHRVSLSKLKQEISNQKLRQTVFPKSFREISPAKFPKTFREISPAKV